MKKWLYSILTVLLFLGVSSFFVWTEPDETYLREQTFQDLFGQAFEQLQKNHPKHPLELKSQENISKTNLKVIQQKIESSETDKSLAAVQFDMDFSIEESRSKVVLTPTQGKPVESERFNMNWLSILPPLIAVCVALLTQKLLLSLFLAVVFGSIFAQHFDILQGVWQVFANYIYQPLTTSFNLQILFFVALLLGLVGLMNASGGTRGIIVSLSRFTGSRRSTQLMTYFMGILVFFDDYANSFIIGGTMRGITDKLKISREKLAFIVDSTAAPISGLAIISTWIGYEVSLFQDALKNLNLELGGYQAFLQAIPYRFYCILTLVTVFLVIWLRKDFGPMYTAEKRAYETGMVLRDGATPMTSRSFSSMEMNEEIPARWFNAVLPIGVVILTTVLGLFWTGGGFELLAKDPMAWAQVKTYGDAFSNADSGYVLLLSAIVGCVFAFVLLLPQRILSPKELTLAWGKGVSSVGLASLILILAWALNNVSKDLGTGTYLISVFKDMVAPAWVPVLIFVLSGAIAFATGSSWSTMAILIPMAVPLAYELGGIPLMIIAMGAVLDGSIFGDHCSPLSDTTILSSIACACDHLDHVKTQIPYALLTMVVATFACYFPAALNVTPFALIGGGSLLLLGVIWVIGKNPAPELPAPPGQPAEVLSKPTTNPYSQEF